MSIPQTLAGRDFRALMLLLTCMQKGEAFLASPSVQAALDKEQGIRRSQHASYLLEGEVPADLETIFCRGIEWDSGVEHVLLLQVRMSTKQSAERQGEANM